MSDSNWEELKARSHYHFNSDVVHPVWDNVQYLGRIRPNWNKELKKVIDAAGPVTWRTRGRPNDDLKRPDDDFDKEEYDLEQAGYGRDHVVSDLTYTVPKVFQTLADQFGLDKPMVRIHVQRPGQVWNLHLDKLEKWMPDNPEQVVRYFVQLTDWEMGHFWNYGNFQWWGWKAGEVTTFDWLNVPHSTANAGFGPRVTLQITGIKTEKTSQYLSTFKYI